MAGLMDTWLRTVNARQPYIRPDEFSEVKVLVVDVAGVTESGQVLVSVAYRGTGGAWLTGKVRADGLWYGDPQADDWQVREAV